MAFRILSLDGGGTWSLIQARVLLNRYGDVSGHEVLRKFDMAIANSGGSLVLALLCADVKLSKIVGTFNKLNVLQEIFTKKLASRLPKFIKDLFPNYKTENKLEVFRQHLNWNEVKFGDKLLSDLPKLIGKETLQLLITGFDYDRERAVYFRSRDNSMMDGYMIQNKVAQNNLRYDFKTVTLAQAVHASANPPVQYFDNPAAFPLTRFNPRGMKTVTKADRLFWDGGVAANNNPVKSGVLEALANGARYEDIEIVSIGTANTVQPVIYGEQNEAQVQYDFLCRYSKINGWMSDLKKIASSILSDPPDTATFDVHQILRLPYQQNIQSLIRINPLLKPKLVNQVWVMPGKPNNWIPSEMEKLFTLDLAVATKEGVDLINKLCLDYFADTFDNQGIRIGGEEYEAILGHKLYSDAMADWRSWPNH